MVQILMIYIFMRAHKLVSQSLPAWYCSKPKCLVHIFLEAVPPVTKTESSKQKTSSKIYQVQSAQQLLRFLHFFWIFLHEPKHTLRFSADNFELFMNAQRNLPLFRRHFDDSAILLQYLCD